MTDYMVSRAKSTKSDLEIVASLHKLGLISKRMKAAYELYVTDRLGCFGRMTMHDMTLLPGVWARVVWFHVFRALARNNYVWDETNQMWYRPHRPQMSDEALAVQEMIEEERHNGASS